MWLLKNLALQNLCTTETRRHREKQQLTRINSVEIFFEFVSRFSPCLCVSDETTSHSTKAGNIASQVVGYVVKAFRFLFFSSLALTLVACEAKLPSPFKASDVSSRYAQADFHLFDADGKPRSLADYRGKVVALFFGYTHCPDVCPTTLADMAQVMRQLDKDDGKLQVLFVTLDPQRDTREMLAQYVPAFHPRFMGLSGDAGATAQVAKAFGVMYQKQTGKNGGYTLDHSAGTYLIAPDGKTVLLAPYQQKTEFLVQDIKLLLALSR